MTDGDDEARVGELLGRPPRSHFDVVVRDDDGDPVVIRNAPFLHDGTPMPTMYWLVGASARHAVDQLEAAGGVRRAEADVDPDALADAHRRYGAEREATIPRGWRKARPSGGVGGTRRGVKCLHAHYAWYLAGGDDPVGAWVAAHLGGAVPGIRREATMMGSVHETSDAVAVIDCGTNSTRLLVSGPDGAPRARLMRITQLGEGLDETGNLSEAAIERTVGVLHEFRSVIESQGVGRVRMTATAAARDASNGEQFLAAAEDAVGVVPELLPGAEEGRLSFIGAVAELDPADGPWLVADIGGGSTELVVGSAATIEGDLAVNEPSAVHSLRIGCVRVTERFHLAGNPPNAAELTEATEYIDSLLDNLSASKPAYAVPLRISGRAVQTMVGLAGTVAGLARLDLELDTYDRDRIHHHRLGRETVDHLLSSLASQGPAERLARPGMEVGRQDVIVGGTLILSRLLHHFDFDACVASEADILDGLTMTLLTS